MGIINFDEEKKHLDRIQTTLSRRGLKPDLESEWEIHGTHNDMNYQVYVGYAIPADDKQLCQAVGCDLLWNQCKKHTNFYCVAIYPKAVYEIEEPEKCWDVSSENRIFIKT